MVHPVYADLPTTIFEVMSGLARDTGAINLGQGFPDEDGPAEVLEAAVKAVGNTTDQTAMADWLRSNSVETVLGSISWDQDGRPQGEFLTGQWQNNKVEYILPQKFATTDQIVMGWEPGSNG